MKKLAVFDLDGTILDTIDDIMNGLNYCLEKYGFPKCTKKQTLSYIGDGLSVLLQRALGEIPSNFEEIYNEMTEYYFNHLADKTVPYDGMVKVLIDLKESGYYLAVLSNKVNEATCWLVNKFYKGIFDVVFGQRNGVPKKPSPEALYEIMKQMNVDSSETIYIGDSNVDYYTAKNAGVDCILVSYGFRDKNTLKLLPNVIIVDDPIALYTELKRINK